MFNNVNISLLGIFVISFLLFIIFYNIKYLYTYYKKHSFGTFSSYLKIISILVVSGAIVYNIYSYAQNQVTNDITIYSGLGVQFLQSIFTFFLESEEVEAAVLIL
jgi:hypothetical protein